MTSPHPSQTIRLTHSVSIQEGIIYWLQRCPLLCTFLILVPAKTIPALLKIYRPEQLIPRTNAIYPPLTGPPMERI